MGTGTAVATGDTITAAKMNLKVETVEGTDLGTADYVQRTFQVNGFEYKTSAAQWVAAREGAHLPVGGTLEELYIRLNFLKIGDVIQTYILKGNIIKETLVVLNCKLVKANLADPITMTDITNGAISEVTTDGVVDAVANPDDETVVDDDHFYYLEIKGTTGAGADHIIIIGAAVTIRRKL